MDEQREAGSAAPRWRNPSRRVVLALTVGALVLGGVAFALVRSSSAPASATSPTQPANCTSSSPRLTVQGSGQGSGTPDVLTAAFGFSTTAGSSAAALSQNNGKVTQALAALKQNGVADRDMQTTGLNLSAQYSYPHGVATLTGYQATETLTATLRQPTTEGTAIDSVVSATGNAAQINSLTFSFANPSAVQDRARTAAVHQAVAHAHAMAAAAGRRLGPVCSLTDNTQPPSPSPNVGFAEGLAAGSATSVPLAPGTQVESDQVTMVYALER